MDYLIFVKITIFSSKLFKTHGQSLGVRSACQLLNSKSYLATNSSQMQRYPHQFATVNTKNVFKSFLDELDDRSRDKYHIPTLYCTIAGP